jgi:putative addiction module component (TIGR02574 family)
MRSRATGIIEEALSLPGPARAALAGTLLDSLDTEVDPEYEEAWSAEIARRLREIDRGKAKLIPWSHVRRDILRSRRAKKRRPVSR